MVPRTKAVTEPMFELKVRITEFNPDRTPYKQYNTRFQADDLYVIIKVPMVYVLYKPIHAGEATILSLDGMAYVNNEIASANERMHHQWMENQK